jgi:hypothetical protein
MKEFILFMRPAGLSAHASPESWQAYFAKLRAANAFDGGSAIGRGECVSKTGTPPPTTMISGYVRIKAADLDAAKLLVVGNPVYESGGVIEIRELPKTG